MLMIKFQGIEYLFTGDSLADGGAITDEESYKNGTISYAHLLSNGTVKRFKQVVGSAADIEVLGPAREPEPTLGGVINLLTGNTWEALR